MKKMGFTHESSANESKEWYTPPRIFDAIGLPFDVDVASPGASVVPWIPAMRHITAKENGLCSPWHGRVWLNPPYGSDTPRWVARFAEHDRDDGGLMLVFARTDTAWFHDHADAFDAVLFIRGRISFIRGDGFVGGGCGAASMLLARGEECAGALRRCGLGLFISLSLNRVGS